MTQAHNKYNQTKSIIKRHLQTIIFGIDTPLGRLFDVILLVAIMLSVLVVLLDSVEPIHQSYGTILSWITWFFTFLFSVEYLLRIYVSVNRLRYIFSFYGMVDLLSIIPVYLEFFFQFADMSLVIRILRVFRIFRILKLLPYIGEIHSLTIAIFRSMRKIVVFFFSILLIVLVLGTLMYVVEGPDNGFTSIPQSLYWSIVTITTVGYGDITPHTILGQSIAALTMLIGYSIIAIPTGIVTAEIAREIKKENTLFSCPNCQKIRHDKDASFCDQCGSKLDSTADLR